MSLKAIKKITIGIVFLIYSADSFSQKVKEDYIVPALYENFDSEQGGWQTTNNIDNFFLIQNGEYILERKNSQTPYAILADWPNTLKEFSVKVSLKLESGNKPESSIGVIVLAQPDRRGAFFIELGTEKRYRIRKLEGIDYKLMTGTAKESGWVKSNTIKEGNYNLIDIKVARGYVDFYINNKFLISLSEPMYEAGDIGFMIGPGTKAKADFFYVYSPENAAGNPLNNKEGEIKANSNDLMSLTDAIVKLKTKNNQLNLEITELKKQIAILETGVRKNDDNVDELNANVKKLQKQNEKLKFSNDSLLKLNKQLAKYKDIVSGNENGDLVISLSSSLQKEKSGNLFLNNQNKLLQDSIKVLLNLLPAEIRNANQVPPANNKGTAPKTNGVKGTDVKKAEADKNKKAKKK